jgi:hypothetical protein
MNNLSLLAAPAGATLQSAAPTAEPLSTIFDRYAHSVIGCYARHYDTVEVHGVRNFASGADNATCYEIDNLMPTSFSVYVHLKDGGLDCVGDFGNYADAVQYSAEVSAEYGWPVWNQVLNQHRTTDYAKLQ